MELRLFFQLFRRWGWLLLLGGVLGGAAGYFVTQLMPEVYQTSTTLLLIPDSNTAAQATSRNASEELIRSYTQLIDTRPVLSATAAQLGFGIQRGQVSVRPVPQTRLFQVSAEATDPQQAADIANAIVVVLIEQNDALQEAVFASSADGLEAQIAQIEAQLAAYEADIAQLSESAARELEQQLTDDIAALELALRDVQREIANLETQRQSAEAYQSAEATRTAVATVEAAAAPNATPTATTTTTITATATVQPTATPTPVIFTLDQQVTLAEKEAERSRLEQRLGRYEQAYFDLTVAGSIDSSEGNSIGEALRLEQLRSQFAFYQNLYVTLLSEYEAARMATLNEQINVVQLDQAPVPRAPVRPRLDFNVMAGITLGLLLCGTAAFLIEYADDTIKSHHAVADILGTTLLGKILDEPGNKKAKVLVQESPRSAYAESIRTLRANLAFSQVDSALRTLVVTSADPGDGKTTVVANLGAAIAQTGKRVILVDGDLRRPTLRTLFSMSGQVGLTNVLTQQVPLEDALQPISDSENLLVLPSGALPPNPAEILGSTAMNRLLETLKTQADIVLIDAPPLVVADTLTLASHADGVLIIVRAGSTREASARAMLTQLNRVNAHVVGIAMTHVKQARGDSYYHYYNVADRPDPRRKGPRSRRNNKAEA